MESGVVVRGLMWREGWWETERLTLLIAYRPSLSLLLSFWVPLQLALHQASASTHVETPTFNQAVLDSHSHFSPVFIFFFFWRWQEGTWVELKSVSILGNLSFRARKKEHSRVLPKSPTFSKCSRRRAVTKQEKKKNLVCGGDSHPTPHQNWKFSMWFCFIFENGGDAFWLPINGSLRAGEQSRATSYTSTFSPIFVERFVPNFQKHVFFLNRETTDINFLWKKKQAKHCDWI